MINESAIAQASLVITKAAFDKNEPDPNRKRRITMTNSDTSPDLYDESMSLGLFKDFTDRIQSNTPVPEAFQDVICEGDVWCGGMPYLSIAHYNAGSGKKNVPGDVDSVYVDGKQLKSKAYLHDTPLGRSLFDAICADDVKKSDTSHLPVRVSIGFLDLEHEHIVEGKSFIFTRTELGQRCALCNDGIGGKIYKKGHLVHLAATRVPVNPRTEMGLEQKSMDEIITKKDDAASIVGNELAEELESKSLVDDILVTKSNEPSTEEAKEALDMIALLNTLNTVKSELDEVKKSLSEYQAKPVVEELNMEQKSHMESEKEEVEDAEKDTEKDLKGKSKSVEVNSLDAQFEALKSAIATGKAEDVQKVFNLFGTEVEKSFTPAPPTASDIAAIVRAAVDEAVTPLKIQLAQVSAQKSDTVSRSNQHPVSRALQLKGDDLVKKSESPKWTQIQRLARKSVGLDT